MLRSLVTTTAFVALATSVAAQPYSECLAPGVTTFTSGAVECQRIDSSHLGAETPFSYYVPPACTLANPCPVLYLLHGTGGSYRSYLGAKNGSSTPDIVLALSREPSIDLHEVDDPWNYPPGSSAWQAAAPRDLILVGPHNRIPPGGYGPGEGMDGMWSDWNPRYAQGGEQELYDTPPPRFESYIVEELIPFVESRLPAIPSRGARATMGLSQGGFGAIKLPLRHPDVFAAGDSLSGGSIPAAWFARVPPLPVGVQPPVPVPTTRIPGVTPMLDYPPETNYLVVPSFMIGWGDPAGDNVHYFSEMPAAIAPNGRAWKDGRQAVAFRATVNDAIPWRTEEFENPQHYAQEQGWETLTFVTTKEAVRSFDVHEVAYEHEVHRGLHTNRYQAPWYREHVEFIWANVVHPGESTDDVIELPDVFDYRSTSKAFSVWGWSFSVERESKEFLDVVNASCSGITLRGTGNVTFEVPAACGTGVDGSAIVEADLGPAQATDEPAHLSTTGAYGRSVTVALESLS